MKTRNLILIGGAGLVAAYVIYMRKRPSGSASVYGQNTLQSDDVPVDSIDANEPKASAARARKKTSGLTLGQIGSRQASAPNGLNGFNQVFSNRVYTKVKDFYGEDANIGLYPESKRLALFQRIWMKLSQNGVSNPMMATLGQIGPAIKEIAQEGFDFRD
jgi:hypothetical protein